MGTIRAREFIYCANAAVNLSGKGIVSAGQMGNFYGELCNSRLFRISGPMAFSTHKYISDLLGDMTIDRRDDTQTMGGHRK